MPIRHASTVMDGSDPFASEVCSHSGIGAPCDVMTESSKPRGHAQSSRSAEDSGKAYLFPVKARAWHS